MIPPSLLPTKDVPVQSFRTNLGALLRRKLDPAVDEGAFFIAARPHALGVGGRGFRGQEDAEEGAVRGEKMPDGGGLHEGGDAREVNDACFAGFALEGGELGGG